MRVAVVGMNPSDKKFRKNCAMDRLGRWCEELGITDRLFINCSTKPGHFDVSTVDREAVHRVVNTCDRVIALGNVPSSVLKKLGVAHHRMPHPSPRNRKFNDPEYEPVVLTAAREYLYGGSP